MRHALVLASITFVLACIPLAGVNAQQCTPGWRPVTATDIQRAATIGIPLTAQTPCLDPDLAQLFDSAATTGSDKEYLLSRLCGNRQPGFPPGFDPNNTDPNNWNNIRSNYVYLSGGNASMDPGALRCFREFFQSAEAQGMQPCITAGFRTPAHQRSSCLDPVNDMVCGRSGGARPGQGPISSCPTDLRGYSGCAHVNGYALDIKDNRDPDRVISQYTYSLLALARNSGKFSKVGAGNTDPWHIEAQGCTTGGASIGNTTDTWQGNQGGLGGGVRGTLEEWGFSTPSENPAASIPSSGDVVTTQPITQTPINWGALSTSLQGKGPSAISPQMTSMNAMPVSRPLTPAPQTVTSGVATGGVSGGKNVSSNNLKDIVTTTPLTKPSAAASSSPSARDALIAIIEGTEGTNKSTTVETSSGVPRLTVDSGDAAQLAVPSKTDQVVVGTVTLVGGQPAQTFISPDLAHSVPTDTSSQRAVWTVLENMRVTLARALQTVQPFNTRTVLLGAPAAESF